MAFYPVRRSLFRRSLRGSRQEFKDASQESRQNAYSFEDEFVTLLCPIKACLNSRPIALLSIDMSALTSGHFFVGRPLVAVPEESILAIDLNRLSRWQLVSALRERIWLSWSQDYLQ